MIKKYFIIFIHFFPCFSADLSNEHHAFKPSSKYQEFDPSNKYHVACMGMRWRSGFIPILGLGDIEPLNNREEGKSKMMQELCGNGKKSVLAEISHRVPLFEKNEDPVHQKLNDCIKSEVEEDILSSNTPSQSASSERESRSPEKTLPEIPRDPLVDEQKKSSKEKIKEKKENKKNIDQYIQENIDQNNSKNFGNEKCNAENLNNENPDKRSSFHEGSEKVSQPCSPQGVHSLSTQASSRRGSYNKGLEANPFATRFDYSSSRSPVGSKARVAGSSPLFAIQERSFGSPEGKSKEGRAENIQDTPCFAKDGNLLEKKKKTLIKKKEKKVTYVHNEVLTFIHDEDKTIFIRNDAKKFEIYPPIFFRWTAPGCDFPTLEVESRGFNVVKLTDLNPERVHKESYRPALMPPEYWSGQSRFCRPPFFSRGLAQSSHSPSAVNLGGQRFDRQPVEEEPLKEACSQNIEKKQKPSYLKNINARQFYPFSLEHNFVIDQARKRQ